MAISQSDPVELDPLHHIQKGFFLQLSNKSDSVNVDNYHCMFWPSVILHLNTALNAGSGPQPI